jgi:hypothetical protein
VLGEVVEAVEVDVAKLDAGGDVVRQQGDLIVHLTEPSFESRRETAALFGIVRGMVHFRIHIVWFS